MSDCIDHGRTKSLDKAGYLLMQYKGKVQFAHRVAYCEARQIPMEYISGSVIRHTCDNPRCINPQHLLVGTQQDNMADKVKRHRQAKGVTNGRVKLTEEDVAFIRKHYKPRCKEHGCRVLAKRFGVDHMVISRIVNRQCWAHI